MAVTVVEALHEIHWLFSDRLTVEWRVQTEQAPVGTEGRELDTGQRFYLDASQHWQPWVDLQAQALQDILTEQKSILARLRQIQFNTGLIVGKNLVGLAVKE